MKFNFKKVASVIASAVMITSTVGFAAASTYPDPFTSGTAVVYGANAAASDIAAAISISNNLNSKVVSSTTTGTVATTSGGDSAPIQVASTFLHVGDNLTSVKTTPITSSDMPNLLADGTYRSHDSNDYPFTQKLVLASGLRFTQFHSSDFNNNAPAIGIMIPQSTPVMNYTVSFSTPIQSTVPTTGSTSGHLTSLENSKITLLGREYTIQTALNQSHIELDLMSGSTSDTVNLNEEKTYTIGNQTYTVKLTFTDGTYAKFTVNGETTDSIAAGGTYKLSDGTILGVRSMSYQAFAGGVMSADISLGAGVLKIIDGSTVQLNSNNINGLVGYVNSQYSGSSSTPTQINSITLQWSTDDRAFMTAGTDLAFPGLQSVKLTMGNLTTPDTETTKVVTDGNSAIELQTVLKDGAVNLDLLAVNATGGINQIGEYGSSSAVLLTTSGSAATMNFSSDTDAYFVASYISGAVGESYLLRAKTSQTGSSTNQTTISEYTNDNGWTDKATVTAGNTVTIGNVVLTATAINYIGHNTTITGGTGVYFDRLVTKDGLLVYLPVNSVAAGATLVNLTAQPTSYNISMVEEDKNNNVGSGMPINVSVAQVSGSSSGAKVQVGEIYGSFADNIVNTTTASALPTITSGSSVRIGYEASALATNVLFDMTNTPYTATINYHGGESYGNVFVASSGVIVTPGSSGGSSSTSTVNIVTDSDVGSGSAYANENLIVIGGSCINTVALKIIDSTATTPLCGNDFTTKTKVGSNQYLISTVANPYAASGSGKIAMLVAGYEAADTTNAAQKVLEGVDTTVGKSQVYPIVTASA